MSKIEELIQQYCPDGVEYIPLGEIGINLDKKRKPITAGNRIIGNIPYYGASGIVDHVKDYIFDGEYLLVSEDGANLITRTYPIAFSINGKTWVNNHAHVIEFKERATRKYIEHYLNSIDLSPWISSGAQPKLNQENLNKIPIPFPPLPIQEEIIRILDTFTELQAELQSELQVRQLQYQYYRDKVLTFNGRNDVEWKKLGDVCSIKARIGWQRLNKSEYLSNGDYYLVTGVDINGARVDFNSCYYVSKERYEMDENIQLKNGDVILTKDGTIGKVALIENMDKPGVLNSHLFVIRDISGKLIAKYLMYILLSHHFQNFVVKNQTQGTIPGLNQATVIKFELPIPSLAEQQKIVDILDRFDTLTNDLSQGLPAEIEARKQQYDYYRDKLLTFKRKGA